MRMSPETFAALLALLEQQEAWITGQRRGSDPIAPEDRLAMTLFYLGSGCSHGQVAPVFGVTRSTVQKNIDAVCKAIIQALESHPDYGLVPHTEDQVRDESYYWSGGLGDVNYRFGLLRGCVGAADGTIIPVTLYDSKSDEVKQQFYGRYKHTNVNIVALINYNMTFRYLSSPYPGSTNDATIVNVSKLKEAVPDGAFMLFDAGAAMSHSVLTPMRAVRYHLSEWARPGQGRVSNAAELFNLRHSSRRMRVECAFGLLKNKFKILRTGVRGELAAVNDRLLACFLLHNFVLLNEGQPDAELRGMMATLAAHKAEGRPLPLPLPLLPGEREKSAWPWRQGLADDAWLAYCQRYALDPNTGRPRAAPAAPVVPVPQAPAAPADFGDIQQLENPPADAVPLAMEHLP